jgi:hypothetical protein
MFRKIEIALVLVGIAIPVRALTVKEVESAGFNNGMAGCNAITTGANTLMKMAEYSSSSKQDTAIGVYISKISDKKGKNDPLVKAYNKSYLQGMEPCEKEFKVLLKKGWNAK